GCGGCPWRRPRRPPPTRSPSWPSGCWTNRATVGDSPCERVVIADGNGAGVGRSGLEEPIQRGSTSFRIVPDRAALVLVARSNAGPITFGATGIEGSISAQVTGGEVATTVPPVARLEVPVQRLTCGN